MLEIGQSARKYRWKYRWGYSGMNPDLAFLIGVYLGDGTIVAQKHSLKFVLQSIDADFTERVRQTCGRALGHEFPAARTYNYKSTPEHPHKHPVNKLDISCGDFAEWMMNLTKCKGILPLEIPREKGNPLALACIAGFLDSDGFICHSTKQNASGKSLMFNIGFGGIYPWIHEMADLIRLQGCDVRGPWLIKRKHVFYDYRIRPRSFINSPVYFTIKRKCEKVEILRKQINQMYPSETVCHTPKEGEETVQQ